jgi:rod shape-determining protein MreC
MKRLIPNFSQTAVLVLVVGGVLLLALGGYLNPFLRVALDPLVSVQQWLSSRYLAIVEFVTVPRDVATLRQRNLELESKVASLETQIVQLQQQLSEAQVLYALLDFAKNRPQNTYIAAAVIGRDPVPFLRYVQIDKGSDDGIKRGMPVVNEQGLIGRVDAVTAGAARVQLITDSGSSVNVRLSATQTDVMLVGSVTGELSLDMIPQNITVKPGDLVLTSGLGGVYPSDLVVGQIVSVRKRETDLFQTASVQPAANLPNLHAVLVVTNFHPVDIVPLMPTTTH